MNRVWYAGLPARIDHAKWPERGGGRPRTVQGRRDRSNSSLVCVQER